VAGGFILSRYVDKGKTVVATASAFLITAIVFGLFTVLPSSGVSWWILLLIVGSGISGGQFVLNALAAGFYPPVIRSTGVGWGFSFGRIGAILSGFAGGLILEMQVGAFRDAEDAGRSGDDVCCRRPDVPECLSFHACSGGCD
jgi:AAHS family 4-hydroxybenzoate transporter-like MFS transporter